MLTRLGAHAGVLHSSGQGRPQGKGPPAYVTINKHLTAASSLEVALSSALCDSEVAAPDSDSNALRSENASWHWLTSCRIIKSCVGGCLHVNGVLPHCSGSCILRPKCNALARARLQGVLAIVGSELHVFNEVNLSTAVSRMAKLCDPAVGLASAAQHPAFAQLKTAVSASRAILCSWPLCSVRLYATAHALAFAALALPHM